MLSSIVTVLLSSSLVLILLGHIKAYQVNDQPLLSAFELMMMFAVDALYLLGWAAFMVIFYGPVGK